MKTTLNQTWDLDSIFPGGSSSDAFRSYLTRLENDALAFSDSLSRKSEVFQAEDWVTRIETIEDILNRNADAESFVSCLEAANQRDAIAKSLRGRVTDLEAKLDSLLIALDTALLDLSDDDFGALLNHPRLASVRFGLEERKKRAKDKLGPAEEKLLSDVMVDGYHAWGQLYDTIVSRMTLPFEENGQVQHLSMGQAHNKMMSESRATRDRVFTEWEKTWADNADLCADALNHLAGFRLYAYRHRGWTSVLREPLEQNRMDETTLYTMWAVISDHKQVFVDYLNRKAKLLQIGKLSWSDVDAPIGEDTRHVSYDEAREFIIHQFERFSPDMANFANSCFQKRWIEAEDRPGKRPGAFCTSFPHTMQTRVFTTFGGTVSNVSTLAHELGHAYHQHVMQDLPRFAQDYAMNVAETASTFAEMITSDAAVKSAATVQERISLLNDQVQRSVAMFMNIHARFLFETRFYEERREGIVSVERLNQLMEQAQREAFLDALGTYHPHFWASKLHFYRTGQPFYNFPYTFGYLFSTGIYARSLAEGPAFAARYVDLLRDTGSMRVEDLANKHLDVDLCKPDFWKSSIALTVDSAREFLTLTDDLV